jgi:hypothetical protein
MCKISIANAKRGVSDGNVGGFVRQSDLRNRTVAYPENRTVLKELPISEKPIHPGLMCITAPLGRPCGRSRSGCRKVKSRQTIRQGVLAQCPTIDLHKSPSGDLSLAAAFQSQFSRLAQCQVGH